MTLLIDKVRITHELPERRGRMRYLKLREPLFDDAQEPEATAIQCYVCSELLLSSQDPRRLAGLAIKCPECGTVSEV